MGNYNWGSWLIESVIAIFFISGFVVFYHQEWLPLLGRRDYSPRMKQRMTHVGMTAFIFLMAIFFQAAAWLDPINSLTYLNFSLYVLIIPLMDNQVFQLEFWVRAAGLVLFWVYNDLVLGWWFALSLVSLLLILIVINRWGDQIRDRAFADLGMSFWIGITFWMTQTQLVHSYLVMGIAMFFLMNVFNFFYWTAARRSEAEHTELVKQVNVDALTRVKNFSAFQRDGRQLMLQSIEPVTLVMFDIDHFKQVNDRYGHTAGNFILSEVARSIQQILADSPLTNYEFYRTGGEEFNIIFAQRQTADVLDLVVDFWRQIREHNFKFEEFDISITLSVGVTQRQASDTTFAMLYKRADDNLYHSKQNGRNTITVEGEIYRSNHRHDVALTYRFFNQPIVDVATQKPIRNELLLRMYHPRFKQWQLPRIFEISADTQIELLKTVLPQLEVKRVSINLTARQFANKVTARRLTAYFQHETSLQEMVVEVTEVPTPDVMHQISPIYHAGGVKIAIDDVESDNGFEVVVPLLADVDMLKFALQNLAFEKEQAQVWEQAAFWYDLAQQHQLAFVLEGVENGADLALAKQLGITQAQGYYYGRPILPALD
ncbi:sensor domain-containing diguanylate cyclase [Loigolactobacillus bifermentans]|uniref:Signal transduction diguanylate cyclase n=1 Tax=Loigolactobacillus bifermentans DSM 20003 TaxID=1423726 RepID=A0A0R1H0G6_9LACO|nr:diguanylate cyclase [Loigolactobacillus bifermentans]KRK39903.1 Signal transduction diguanylate cyclase [Loigolactobacillus bifermentans DSM 20003]QGG60434.1 diguanylate cyclase [Loigolactobacillus bifermentans]